ncbi:hypothetical protein GCM10010329_58430 [Streptomyces spiroverticillatus]|uniref:Dynamin N-terminal domain-containing protein n=1 Tax=Streptomyces finlayi TaxID=67296 RepID=A0A918X3J5_9ACTN|nr:dynamin family protein [Streptomyces finlayi]GHA27500.1 hypothetical protein GCM10010329_58430 [Streptomyces spiroverticillatus]GHD08612.1 hypothetical protein GCM10010334_62090 [Streptomyces finlayi]
MAEVGIAGYARWASDLNDVLDRAPSGGGGVNPELSRRRAEFGRAVDRLAEEARDPLTVGVVGEYSAGKSLLIEALLGLPDLLTVSDVATTGNITALHVVQAADESAAPSVESREVVYCTAAEMTELMQHLHHKLTEVAALENLGEQALADLRAARPSERGRQALTEWYGRYAEAELGAKTASLIDEIRKQDTAYAHAHLLGRRYQLSEDQAKRAMSMPDLKLKSSGPGARSLGNPEQGEQIPDDVLVASVPLIRRVNIRLRVPRRIWDLGEAGALTLLDSAGLNSSDSRERDRFLSIRELRDVHTILILISALRGPVGSEQDFLDMLRRPTNDGRPQRSEEALRRSLLVAGGRFADLRVTARTLRAVLLDTSEALTERRLLGLAETAMLNKLVTAAYKLPLGRQEKQLSLVSAVVGLESMAAKRTVDLDPAFRARLGFDETLAKAMPVVNTWREVAARLEADDPGTPLGRALGEYARDGGLDHLRGQLTRHARDHGGAIKLDAVHRRAQAVDTMRLALIKAEREYTEVEHTPEYEDFHSALSDTRRLLAELRERLVLGIAPGVRAQEEARREIEAEAAYLVARWPQWKHIFSAVDRNKQLIKARTGEEARDPGSLSARAAQKAKELGLHVPDTQADQRSTAVPGEPGELLQQFRDCHRRLLHFVHNQALAGFEQRLEGYADAMDELYETWERLLSDEGRGARKPEHNQRLSELLYIADIDDWTDRLRRASETASEAVAPEAAYPLRLDRAFPWHPAPPEGRDELEQHVVHALRIRRELVAALVHAVQGHLARGEAVLMSAVDKHIRDAEETVNAPETLDLHLPGADLEGAGRRNDPWDVAVRLEALPQPASSSGTSRRLLRQAKRSKS